MEREWVELVPVMLAPCTGCGALWEPDQSCPICNDVDLSNTNEEKEYERTSWGNCG